MIDKYGYDQKMGYHVLRLLDEIEQMLTIGDIDLMRNREECKAMRNGEWGNFPTFENHVHGKLKVLEDLSLKTSLAQYPQKEVLHVLLSNYIEEFYGSLDKYNKAAGSEFISCKDVFDKLEEINKKLG